MSKKHQRRLCLLKIDPHCFYCGTELDEANSTIDHVFPRSKGGTNLNNTVLACKPCNKKKADCDPLLMDISFYKVYRINLTLRAMQYFNNRYANKRKKRNFRKPIDTLMQFLKNDKPL